MIYLRFTCDLPAIYLWFTCDFKHSQKNFSLQYTQCIAISWCSRHDLYWYIHRPSTQLWRGISPLGHLTRWSTSYPEFSQTFTWSSVCLPLTHCCARPPRKWQKSTQTFIRSTAILMINSDDVEWYYVLKYLLTPNSCEIVRFIDLCKFTQF